MIELYSDMVVVLRRNAWTEGNPQSVEAPFCGFKGAGYLTHLFVDARFIDAKTRVSIE